MSTCKANNFQIGQSVTATNNFCLYQPSSPDGTVRLGNGNSGSVTDLVTLTSAGNLGIGTSSPQSLLHLNVDGTALRISRGSAIGFLYNTGTSATDITRLQSNGGSVQLYTTGGTATLDASGNLGLGVTPSAWRTDVSFKALQMPGGTFAAYVAGGLDPTPNISANAYVDSTGTWRYISSRAASWYIQNGGMHAWYTAASGTAGNAISFTQAMTLDASGNLLVGDTSNVSSVTRVYSKFAGAAGASGFYSLQSSAGGYCYSSNAALNGSTYYHVIFYDAGVSHGSITSNGTNTAYNQSSDQRLKTDLGPVTETSVIDNTVIHDFEWKSTGTKARGVFAQEAQKINPNAVTPGQSDELNADGLPVHPWGVDYSKYVPDLIVYCQQLRAEIETLKQKVNA